VRRKRKKCHTCKKQNPRWKEGEVCPDCIAARSAAAEKRIAAMRKVSGLGKYDMKTVASDTLADDTDRPGGDAMGETMQAAVSARVYLIAAKLREINPRRPTGQVRLLIEVTPEPAPDGWKRRIVSVAS
jgi:hypothetical protein